MCDEVAALTTLSTVSVALDHFATNPKNCTKQITVIVVQKCQANLHVMILHYSESSQQWICPWVFSKRKRNVFRQISLLQRKKYRIRVTFLSLFFLLFDSVWEVLFTMAQFMLSSVQSFLNFNSCLMVSLWKKNRIAMNSHSRVEI